MSCLRKAIDWLKGKGVVPGPLVQETQAAKAEDKKAKCYPLPGEKQDVFMSRCMTHMMEDRGKEHQAALGACLGIWGEHGTKEKKNKGKRG